MNSKAIKIIRNFTYSFTSSLVSMIISSLVILIVPKLIGIKEYGYWQLYLFYSSYVGFLHLGWNDGIYLRYGGKKYDELDKRLFFSQFYMLFISQIIIALIVILSVNILEFEQDKLFIIQMTAVCMVIMNVNYMLLFILQGTNRIKEYAQITMMDRVLYCLIIIFFLFFGVREYKLMVVADVFGKFICLLFAMYYCRDIVFQKISTFYLSIKETIDNINVGIKLMFSNIASMLIMGVVRFGIENTWDVTTFAKVSLTLSVSNLMMVFINAIGLIMFPLLRRTDEERLSHIYITMRDFLMVVLLGMMMLYYPIRVLLMMWLPEYTDSLMYMALLFPMCIYEGKMSLLINTYLKTLREEKAMLKVNLIALGFALILTFITTILIEDLNLAILSIMILLVFRCICAEIYLSKIMNISVFRDIILEIIMTIIFILGGWFVNPGMAVVIYALSYVTYLFIKRKDILSTINNIKLLLKA